MSHTETLAPEFVGAPWRWCPDRGGYLLVRGPQDEPVEALRGGPGGPVASFFDPNSQTAGLIAAAPTIADLLEQLAMVAGEYRRIHHQLLAASLGQNELNKQQLRNECAVLATQLDRLVKIAGRPVEELADRTLEELTLEVIGREWASDE